MNLRRSVIIAQLQWPSRKTLKFCKNFLRFLEKTTPYSKISKILFRKFSSWHRSTLLCSNFVKYGRRKIGEIMRYLLHTQTHTNKISPASQTVATVRIAPKICQGQPPTMFSDWCRFHPNRFTFGGAIAEHVNTAESPRKVNPMQSKSSFKPNNYKDPLKSVITH